MIDPFNDSFGGPFDDSFEDTHEEYLEGKEAYSKRKKQNAYKIGTPLAMAYKELMSGAFPTTEQRELPKLKEFAELIKLESEIAAVLVMLYVKHEQNIRVDQKEIVNFLAPILMLKPRLLRKEIREMMCRGIVIFRRSDEDFTLDISHDTMYAIDNGDLEYFHNLGPNGLEKSIEYLYNNLFQSRRASANKMNEIYEEISSRNPDLEIVKYIDENFMFANPEEMYTFLGVVVQSFISKDPFSFSQTEESFPGSMVTKSALRMSIMDSDWTPMKEGYIELKGGGMFDNSPNLKLSREGFEKFYSEMDPKMMALAKKRSIPLRLNIQEPDTINEVPLYFDGELENQLNKIEKLLTGQKLEEYQKSVSGKMHGITMLFYGSPGCGKTEFALQLARKTKRPVIQIQVTDILDKWVGESETKLKDIFKDYKTAMDQYDMAPILFLNEADQLLNKRVEAKGALEQMMNGLQNLFLEEMENFNGIMIGTTNLISNMDRAFERRWIYKVNFGKPTSKAQFNIWKDQIPALKKSELEALIQKFDFTPGEISNVAKRWQIEKLIGDGETEFDILLSLCNTETFASQSEQKFIGFEMSQKKKESLY